MSVQSLHGTWKCQQIGSENIKNPFDVQIPGYIHQGLIDSKLIDDPKQGQNEISQKWICESDWKLSCRFSLTNPHKNHFLICDGIDTISEIYINDQYVGSTNNEFVIYQFNLNSFCTQNESQNEEYELKIILKSPLKYCIQEGQKYEEKYGYRVPYSRYVNGIENWNFIRKCSASFGWDWGPCVPISGISNSIKIISFDNAFISDLKCLVNPIDHDYHVPGKKRFIVDYSVYLEVLNNSEQIIHVQIIELDDNGQMKSVLESSEHQNVVKFEKGSKIHRGNLIVDVEPWKVFGYGLVGKNKIYKTVVSLLNEKQTISRSVGFRKVELVCKNDETEFLTKFSEYQVNLDVGESFYIKINDIPIFMKGANYIPCDVIPDKVKSLKLLSNLPKSNINSLRIWGGGRYESESFYDECDRLGILIWYDMMFACSLYPSNKSFLKNVEQEVVSQLRRLSGHPSIVIWAANNENEELLQSLIIEHPKIKENLLIDYQKLTMNTIFKTYKIEMSPADQQLMLTSGSTQMTVPFWPSSPSNGMNQWGVPGDQKMGDCHYWGVWHGNKPFYAYEDVKPRFCSEFGFQSLPNYQDCVKYISNNPDDLNMFSRAMEFRQRSPARGNLGIVSQICHYFRYPSNFEYTCYLSQILQGLALKMGVECWRRLKPYCMGTLYWQLNDIWTGFSWSSINHHGNWKLSHYFVKRFYSPLLISFKFMPSTTIDKNGQKMTETSTENAHPSTEDPKFTETDELSVWITSDYTSDLIHQVSIQNGTETVDLDANRLINSNSTCQHTLIIELWRISKNTQVVSQWEVQDVDTICEYSKPLWHVKLKRIVEEYGPSCQLFFRSLLKDQQSKALYENYHFLVPFKRMELPKTEIQHRISHVRIGNHEKLSFPSQEFENFISHLAEMHNNIDISLEIDLELSSQQLALFVSVLIEDSFLSRIYGSPELSDNAFILLPQESRTISIKYFIAKQRWVETVSQSPSAFGNLIVSFQKEIKFIHLSSTY